MEHQDVARSHVVYRASARRNIEFKTHGGNPICAGIVGVNYAPRHPSYEGRKAWKATGMGSHKHPIQEAQSAEDRLRQRVASAFDVFIVIRFIAENVPPYNFDWVNYSQTEDQ